MSYCVAVRNLDYQLTAKKRQDTSRDHFATALCAGIMATVFVGGAAFAPTPAEAAKTPNCVAKTVKLTPAQLQEIAVKQAIVACKAEAKGKKIRWPASRKFVSTCLSNALKDYHLDVDQLPRRYTPQETGCMQNVYCEEQLKPPQLAGCGGWLLHVRFGSKADICSAKRSCPLYPQKRTCAVH